MRNIEPREFARIFGMSVAALAEYVCYERRSLYNIIKRPEFADRKRFKAFEMLLIHKARQDLVREQREAQERYDKKMAALEYLHKKRQSAAA